MKREPEFPDEPGDALPDTPFDAPGNDSKAGNKPDQAEPEKKVNCRDCNASYTVGKSGYKRVPGGVVCKDQPSCRSRRLTVDIAKELNVQGETWLYSKHPREDLLAEMDIKPEDWKGEWFPSRPEAYRVKAALEYFSWCYPVSIAYAVQIDADGEPIRGRYGSLMWLHHTNETLARFLGMTTSNVTRALQWLTARGIVRVDSESGAIYLVPNPRISPEQRNVLRSEYAESGSNSDLSWDGANLKGLGAVPARLRTQWVDFIRESPESLRSESVLIVGALCSEYSDGVTKLRSERNGALKTEVQRLASLLSRCVDVRDSKRAGDASLRQSSPPAENRPVDGNEGTPHEQEYTPHGAAAPGRTPAQVLYAGIPELQKPYRKTKFGRARFNALGKPDKILAGHVLDTLEGKEWGKQKGRRKPRTVTAAQVEAYLDWVLARFNDGRSPADSNGPDSLGLLVNWAEDLAVEWPEIQREWDLHRARQEAARASDEDFQRSLEAELRVDREVDETWEQMPAPEKKRRLQVASDELKTDKIPGYPRWKTLTKDQFSNAVEQHAKRELRREICEAPEHAQGAGGDD